MILKCEGIVAQLLSILYINVIFVFVMTELSAQLMENPWSQSPALRSSMAQSIRLMGKSYAGQRFLMLIYYSNILVVDFFANC